MPIVYGSGAVDSAASDHGYVLECLSCGRYASRDPVAVKFFGHAHLGHVLRARYDTGAGERPGRDRAAPDLRDDHSDLQPFTRTTRYP